MPGNQITFLSDNVLLLLLREVSWEILLLFQRTIVILTFGIKHSISSNTRYKTRVSLNDDHSQLVILNNVVIVSTFEFPVSEYPLYFSTWHELQAGKMRSVIHV